MATMIESAHFDSFGPSFLADQTRGELQWCRISESLIDSRKLLRQVCPSTPGVYGWLNSARQLIYVGKSKSLRHRLASYFAKTPTDPKMARIRDNSLAFVWEPIADELLALLREQELIHRWRPEFNSQGQPTRRQPAFVCISDSAAPHVFVAKRLGNGYRHAFGPLVGTGDLVESVAAMNYVFGLRDCPDKTRFEFGDQLRLFSDAARAACLRYELGSCPGPCAALCTKLAYQNRLAAVMRFLERGGREFLSNQESRMRDSANQMQFERAAMLRDQLEALNRLDRQLGRLRVAQKTINGVLSVVANRGRQVWLVFRQGQLVCSIVQPRSRQQAITAELQLSKYSSETPQLPRDVLDINLHVIVAAWFRKHPSRLGDLVDFPAMLRRCCEIRNRYESRTA